MPLNDNSLLLQLEKDITTLLLDKLEHQEVTFERSSQIAKFIIASLPDSLTDEQLIQILPKLDDQFVELAGVVNKYLVSFEKQYKQDVATHAQDLIKHGHFQEAHQMMQDYFQKKIVQ